MVRMESWDQVLETDIEEVIGLFHLNGRHNSKISGTKFPGFGLDSTNYLCNHSQ